jgi:hypothetical protein
MSTSQSRYLLTVQLITGFNENAKYLSALGGKAQRSANFVLFAKFRVSS